MGLLDFLFNRSYPTSDWQAFDGRELHFDFDKNALCNVAIGDRMERLRFLGPVEDPPEARQDHLVYRSKGFYVDLEDGRIASYLLTWNDPSCHTTHPTFTGKCLLHGQEIALSWETSEQQVIDSLGEPYWRDEDEDEVILFYEHDQIEWQVEFEKGCGLRAITVVSPPMLADKQQREAYRITKPWPPTQG
jgi:hypothetical protein